MTRGYTLSFMSERDLLTKFDEEGLEELESAYDVDLSEGANVAELLIPSKATSNHIESIMIDGEIDPDAPLLIVSPKGFTESAADLALEYEDVLLCSVERNKWIPWKIPA